MKKQQKQSPHVFFLEQDPQSSRGFPDTFLPENDFFKPKEVKASCDFYTSEWAKPSTWTMASPADLPIKDNQLMLRKYLSEKSFTYERDEQGKKIRGKRFDDIKKIRLKIEEVTCERVKEKRTRK